MLSVLGTILDIASKLSDMISAYIAVRQEQRDIGREGTRRVLDAGEGKNPRLPSEQESKKLEAIIIDKELLDSANERIERAKKRYSDAVKDWRHTPGQLDQETQIAKAEICATLQLIKDHNNSDLPTKELEDLWNAYKCGQASNP